MLAGKKFAKAFFEAPLHFKEIMNNGSVRLREGERARRGERKSLENVILKP